MICGLALALALAPACAPRAGRGPAGELSGSSLLLVTLDTTRADALGCYGGPTWTSPRLDALASAGVRFQVARTTNPVTLPAHATLMTGRLPFEHGVRDNSTFRLPDGAETLAERLLAAGYSTGAVVSAFVLHADFGLDQGFEVYSNAPRRKLELDLVEDQRTATEAVDAALALLDSGRLPAPWFLWVHVFDPHTPFAPPDDLRRRALEGLSPDAPPDEIQRRLYLAEVAYADRELGRLFDAVWARQQPVLTAVVADHGEGLGDHGEPSHGLQLFDTVMRVPLILHASGAGLGAPLGPRAIPDPVSTVDLASTLLSLLGVDGFETSGRDLAELVLGRASRPPTPAPGGVPGGASYLETCHPLYSYGWAPLFALADDAHKVVDGPAPVVFDLRADSGEHALLEGAEADQRLGRARAAFAELAPRTRAGLRIAPTASGARALEALGYTAGVETGGVPEAPPPGWRHPGLSDPGARVAVKRRCELAMSLLARGELERAVETMQGVLAEDPDNPIFLSQAGTIFVTAGRYAEAERALKHCLELREDPAARCSLAVAQNLAGRQPEAIETLFVNAAAHPRHLHTRFALAEMLLVQDRAAEALEHFEAFLAEHEAADDWHRMAGLLAHLARGQDLEARGHPDEARGHLEAFLRGHAGEDHWTERARTVLGRLRP